MTLESGTTTAMPLTIGPIAPSERLPVLDILRGFAILGMFIVHFADEAPGGGAIGETIRQAMILFVENRAYATFAIMFGVGFAIQLHSADTRGEDVRWRFLRRLLGLVGFGVVAAALYSPQLIGYAYTGVWLLVVRRWSARACCSSPCWPARR